VCKGRHTDTGAADLMVIYIIVFIFPCDGQDIIADVALIVTTHKLKLIQSCDRS
jgi:hypothetical protein